jgi:hypothetical protein
MARLDFSEQSLIPVKRKGENSLCCVTERVYAVGNQRTAAIGQPEWQQRVYCAEKLDVKAIFCIGGVFSCILERLMADV